MVDEAKDKAQELASQAQEKASEKLQAGVSRGKNRAADALGSIAQSLAFSSQRLREQDKGAVGAYVEKAADRVENLSRYMQNTTPREMADRFEGFARREPALFLGGAFAAGLVGARFLKSSRKEREYPSGTPYGGMRGPATQQSSRPRGMVSDREIPISVTPRDAADVVGTSTPPGGSVSGTMPSGATAPGPASER